MQSTNILHQLNSAKRSGKKLFAVLIDPDKIRPHNIDRLIDLATEAGVDFFFIGGSLMVNNTIEKCIETIKDHCNIPTVLFPGHSVQLSFQADGILFLSLISGRNPDLLIGQHVIVAPLLKNSNLQIIPTGYILIDGGQATSVTYMSNTTPIPSNKDDIAVCTALAGEMLGLKVIYMDAGSGAQVPISSNMIRSVSRALSVPVIVGGGIKSPEEAFTAIDAGADLIVIGNAIEKDQTIIKEIANTIHNYDISAVKNIINT